MSRFPTALDTDADLIRVDDDITQTGGEAINDLRDAVFNIESTLGINPQGSQASISDRLDTSLDANGHLKASELNSVGLATLPISDSQVGATAGIKESKLDLDYPTATLNIQINGLSTTVSTIATTTINLNNNFNSHLVGGAGVRHVASHVDINAVPSDPRDPLFVWGGLKDKSGVPYGATNTAEALEEVVNNLDDHQNETIDAHPASAISVDTSTFTTIDHTATDVQLALEDIDQFEFQKLGIHYSTMHSAGVPNDERSELLLTDGYAENVVPPTPVITYLAHNGTSTAPVDSTTVGDDIVEFVPSAANRFLFESQLGQAKPGDVIRINYGNGLEGIYDIDSIRYKPFTGEYYVRLNGVNLFETSDGYARIDRPLHDTEVYGIVTCAAANATPESDFPSISGSVIVADPKGASALGLSFDPNQIDQTHYNLYLEFYPDGNPLNKRIILPAIDVSGDAGTRTGKYTLDDIVQATNNKLRQSGYNYRFIAFAADGNFGIMLADSIDNASFSIISGVNSGGTLIVGAYVNNVIGDPPALTEQFDGLGLGKNHANWASPEFQTTYASTAAALLPTKVFVPKKKRDYIVNGQRYDFLAAAPQSNTSRYWAAEISNKVVFPNTIEVTYLVDEDLKDAELMPGKTIVVAPAVSFTDPLYSDIDYGRFIIKNVTYNCPVPGVNQCSITVINGVGSLGVPTAITANPGLPVRLFFSEDSVWFNQYNVIDGTPTGNFERLHEVYVNDQKKTFSHERARMPADQAQSSGPDHLATAYWRIRDISPNLRGYLDTGATVFNKYIRLYILTYDGTTGEYDGYIGQRPFPVATDTILRPGPVVTGRKNLITRFYDETNVDWIDMEFYDPAAAWAGTDIITPAGVGRWVDIELFPSLENNDQFTLLSVFEVSYSPSTGVFVQNVKDKRQRGSISEKEFTQSARDYITAAGRDTLANGIVRGFRYVSKSSVANEFFFDGGEAIVNGNVVVTNQGSVTIPDIFNSHTGGGTTNWAVCVDLNGNFVPVLLTGADNINRVQFFAQNNVSGNVYYVPSVTFDELITAHKELTIIAIIDGYYSGGTLSFGLVEDARKYVTGDIQNLPFTLYSDNYEVGSFTSIAPLALWLLNTQKGYVKTHGILNFTTAELSTVQLVGGGSAAYEVVFEADGYAHWNISTALNIINPRVEFRGMNFQFAAGAYVNCGINTRFKECNIKFNGTDTAILAQNGFEMLDCAVNWNPAAAPAVSPTDIVHSGNGCIYRTGSISDVLIENNAFTNQLTTEQYPFINFELPQSSTYSLRNIKIRGNKFFHPNTKGNAAIAIIGTEGGGGASTPLIEDIFIEDNTVLGSDGIFICGGLAAGSLGLQSYNTTISNNSCGKIGYAVRGWLTAPSSAPSLQPGTASLTIENNTVGSLIATCDKGGIAFGAPILGTGSVVIHNNRVRGISSVFIENNTTQGTASLHITNNILERADISGFGGAFTDATNAILVTTAGASTSDREVIISENSIVRNPALGALLWNTGISCNAPAIITDNNISGFSAGSGIIVGSPRNIITGNVINRDSHDIFAYITDAAGTSIISNNIFDSFTINAALSTATINVVAGVKRVRSWNINQTKTIVIRSMDLGHFFEYTPRPPLGGNEYVLPHTNFEAATIPQLTSIDFASGDTVVAPTTTVIGVTALSLAMMRWYVPIWSILPEDCYVTEASITWDGINVIFWAGGSVLDLKLNIAGGPPDPTLAASAGADMSITQTATETAVIVTPENYPVKDNRTYALFDVVGGNGMAATSFIKLSALTVKYRW